MDTIKEKAKWKIAPTEDIEDDTNDQACSEEFDEIEESDDCEYWKYLSPEMMATDGIKKIGFLRLPEVLTLIPVKKSAWWAGIKMGRFPKGYKLSENITGWDVDEIRALITKLKCEPVS